MARIRTPFADFLRTTSRVSGRAGIDVASFVQTAFKSTDAVFVNKPTNLEVGKMFMFVYDAKHKLTLPFWDKHPLIFPFTKLPDRFIGINFHYLPMNARAMLLDALYSLTTDNSIKDTTKLNLMSYNMLKSFAKFRMFKPCIHMYLNSHVRSRFLTVPATQWAKAILLPTQRFVGNHGQSIHHNRVHASSRKQYTR